MTKALVTLLIPVILVIGGCSDGGGNGQLAPASRDAFIGTWKGKYLGLDDEMIIKAGESDTEVVITLHANHGDAADTVKGNLVAADRIEVPEQSIGNRPGTAVITMTDGKLTLEQSEARGTAKGTGYEKQ